MEFIFNDGGRSSYFKGTAGDCVVRAIAIVTGKDYKKVYDAAFALIGYSPRDGIKHRHTRMLMEHFGGKWHATMQIGSGCKVHLRKEELPDGRLVCKCSGHCVAVIDGVINDLSDPSRGGTRCVYGYWLFN